ncbi:SDR family oxidoreductase [Vreelandella aquamarina]|uniref:UDP-glucose 4-epimerase family protein n=1 Tax=Vreelandella aquamarina TaxID=77097 RepID=UPI00384B1E94
MNLLVTGVTGFVGSQLFARLKAQERCHVVGAGRRVNAQEDQVVIDGLRADTQWREVLANQTVVIHTAARAHIMKDEESDPLSEYRKVNVDGTLNLAKQAAEVGVRRFVFISSIKVNGEQTPKGKPFTADNVPAPEDPYGVSKLEAEAGLHEIGSETGMEVVIIRPPIVYGPGVKGNFASMIKLVEKGLPMPFGAIHNKRSLVALDNLVDLIITCIDHPAAANQVFLAGDGQDVSTTELLYGVGRALGKPTRLIPLPAGMLMFGAGLLGKKAFAQRLLGSLQVDISKARNLLGWQPPLSVEEGLRRCFVSGDEC